MSNHPNRGARTAASSPTPDEIARARMATGLPPEKACQLVFATRNQWLEWESGARAMHPGLLQLFRAKHAIMRGVDPRKDLLDGIPPGLYLELTP